MHHSHHHQSALSTSSVGGGLRADDAVDIGIGHRGVGDILEVAELHITSAIIILIPSIRDKTYAIVSPVLSGSALLLSITELSTALEPILAQELHKFVIVSRTIDVALLSALSSRNDASGCASAADNTVDVGIGAGVEDEVLEVTVAGVRDEGRGQAVGVGTAGGGAGFQVGDVHGWLEVSAGTVEAAFGGAARVGDDGLVAITWGAVTNITRSWDGGGRDGEGGDQKEGGGGLHLGW